MLKIFIDTSSTPLLDTVVAMRCLKIISLYLEKDFISLGVLSPLAVFVHI